MEEWLRAKFYDNRDDLNIPIVNYPFVYSNIAVAHAYWVYIFLSWYDIPELVVTITISLIEGCC